MEATLAEKLALFLILIGSLSVHEWAHAWSADRLGDPTPRSQGRLTLNPLAHIDLLGTVIIPLTMILLAPGFAILGWGRPVMIDPRNFKRPALGDIVTALAGPISNIVLAALVAAVFGAWTGMSGNAEMAQKAANLGLSIIYMNMVLAVFNLLPIPPLDGSHIVKRLVGMGELLFMRYAQWGSLILIVLINIEIFRMFLWKLVSAASEPVLNLMTWVAGWFVR